MAYALISGLRRLGLKATELAQAQVATIRTKLLKIGAQVRISVRKVWISMAIRGRASISRSGQICAVSVAPRDAYLSPEPLSRTEGLGQVRLHGLSKAFVAIARHSVPPVTAAKRLLIFRSGPFMSLSAQFFCHSVSHITSREKWRLAQAEQSGQSRQKSLPAGWDEPDHSQAYSYVNWRMPNLPQLHEFVS